MSQAPINGFYTGDTGSKCIHTKDIQPDRKREELAQKHTCQCNYLLTYTDAARGEPHGKGPWSLEDGGQIQQQI